MPNKKSGALMRRRPKYLVTQSLCDVLELVGKQAFAQHSQPLRFFHREVFQRNVNVKLARPLILKHGRDG
jgi:hypothetical protein